MRRRVSLKMDVKEFERILATRSVNFAEVGRLVGLTRQAVNVWITEERIAPRALSTLATKLNLSADEVSAILGPQRKKNRRKKFLQTKMAKLAERMAKIYLEMDEEE